MNIIQKGCPPDTYSTHVCHEFFHLPKMYVSTLKV
jgi:hypothetical protein